MPHFVKLLYGFLVPSAGHPHEIQVFHKLQERQPKWFTRGLILNYKNFKVTKIIKQEDYHLPSFHVSHLKILLPFFQKIVLFYHATRSVWYCRILLTFCKANICWYCNHQYLLECGSEPYRTIFWNSIPWKPYHLWNIVIRTSRSYLKKLGFLDDKLNLIPNLLKAITHEVSI